MDASALLRPATPAAAMRVTSLLQVAPRAVEFAAFEFHREYVAALSVRNASDRALRFRVVPPAPASPFRVLYQAQDLATTANPTLMLPPGLGVTFEVVFAPPAPPKESDARSVEHALVHDAIQLHGDDGSRVDVPLHARKAFPEIELDASLCDLGLVVLAHRTAKVVRMKNTGSRAGRFDVEIMDGFDPPVPAISTSRRPSVVAAGGTAGGGNNGGASESEAPIVVTPTWGVLLPGESLALKIEVVGKVLGELRGVLRIRIREHVGDKNAAKTGEDMPEDDGSETSLGLSPSAYVVDKIVDVRASVVEHNVELVQRHGGDKVQSLFFGSLFAGESRVIETILRNNGPLPLQFRTTLNFGGGSAGGGPGSANPSGDAAGEEDREAYQRRKELQVYPLEGRVDPFGEVVVTFTYHPRTVDVETILIAERRLRAGDKTGEDFNSSTTNAAIPPTALAAFVSIQCADMQAQNLTFEITGKTFLPKLEVSPASLDFGDIKSYDRADMLVTIKNVSGLPVSFAVPRIAQFSTKPSAGRLDVLQSQSIVVSFVPTQLGTFKATLDVIVNSNIIVFPIRVKGTAAALGEKQRHDLVGGPTALPKDFEPKFKFMLAEDANRTKGKLTRKFNRMAPYELAALNGTAAIDEYEFQGTNNTHLTYCVKELASRAEHRDQYNKFVTDLRQRRDDKAKKKAMALKQTVSMLRTTTSNNEENDEIEILEDAAVNLGMDRQGGIEPRMLKLPRELLRNPDPLWLENQSSMGLLGNSKKHMFDENKFVKKKFKAHPATQAEIADCALSLNFDQLELVTCGPKTINFGKLSVNGIGRKSLSVQNSLLQNIYVTLHLTDADHVEELSAKTTLKSQVIPPQTLAGFDLVFSSSKEQFFEKQLTLTINGVHTRQITIVAEVAPIVVSLSATELAFEFSTTDTNPSMAMEVVVTNTSDSIAPFQWKLLPAPVSKSRPDSSKSSGTTATVATTDGNSGKSTDKSSATKPIFEIVPSSGTLSAAESLRCQILYTPPNSISGSSSTYAVTQESSGSRGSSNQQWLVSDFQLDITGGRKALLACKALFIETKHQLKDKKIDLGMIAVGMEKEKRIVLSNPASGDEDGYSQRLVFYAAVEPPSVASGLGLSISPTIGSILPQDSCEISIKVSPHKPLCLESNAATLNLQLRGGRCIKVPLLANIVIPEVKISQATPISFGEVVIGVSVPRVISLENRSSIAACLIMDLSTSLSEEFSVSLPSKLTKNIDDVSSVFMPLMLPPPSSPISSVGGPDASSDDADSACPKWQLCIPPNTTVSFHLNFTPRAPGTHEAVFPIQFAGLSHASSGFARPESITRRVLATAVAPRVLFSPSALIDFHRCVITREGIRKVPYTKTLQLTNDDPHGCTIKWQIDVSKLKAAAAAVVTQVASKRAASASNQPSIVFHIAPEKGELGPGEDVKVRVSFLPMEAVEYIEDEVPLLIDDKFYINLSVSGIGIHPHLSFSENKIVLPTVPLGMPSVARFFIESTGYDHLELTYRLPLDVSKAPLTLQFPKGKILSMACPKIPCEVRFLSKKSVAFNARIEFFDADGNVFYLPIAGCTENCLLTNREFVSMHTPAQGESTAEGKDEGPDVLPQPSAQDMLCFYTHASNKFPVYLLTKKQTDSETTKCKAQIAKEKGTDVGSGGAAASNGGALPSSAGGFVDIDASAFAPDVNSWSINPQRIKPGQVQPPTYTDREVQYLLQYLNANFLKNPVSRFPQDIADTLGKPLYEFLEMVCTKKPPANAIVGSAVTDKSKGPKASSTSSAISGPSKKELLVQYTSQYTELLKFLKSYGAMLHDVLPEHLLPQDLYVRACEDPRADPAILSSAALLNLKFLQRRHALQSEWASVSGTAWMKILYQVIKCFLLYRITQKSYQQTQQQALSSMSTETQPPPAPVQQSTKDKSATTQSVAQLQTVAVRACQGSNVYSEAEMVLIQWICDHVRSKISAATGSPPPFSPESRLLDLQHDLLDGKMLFHVLASHIPTLSLDSSDYRGFRLSQAAPTTSAAQIQQNAPVLLHTLRCFGVDFGIDQKSFLVSMNGREIVVLLLHLYQMLPQFIPKATIEFKGVLGQDMEKTIELKNPSNRAIQYHVFLDGGEESDFRIESSHVVLEPGKVVGFVVSFKPKFSKKVTARLVFQSVRESSLNTSSGATMVFLLASNITARKPVRIIQTEANVYEKKMQEIIIENQFPANGNYKLTMMQMPMGSTGGVATTLPAMTPSPAGSGVAQSKSKPPITAAKDSPGSFGPGVPLGRRNSANTKQRPSEELSAEHAWCIAAQQPFYLPEYGAAAMVTPMASSSSIGEGGGSGVAVAIRSQTSTTIKLEFLPLVPGNFKCQLLFLDEKVGEFMYEIHGTAHLPVTVETLEFQCELNASMGGGGGRGGGSHFYRELIIPPKNLQLAKALTTFVDRASGLLKTKLKEGLKKCEESHHHSYVVEFNSPYFAPVFQEVTVSHAMGSSGGGGGPKLPKQPSMLNLDAPITSRTEASAVGGDSSTSSKPSEKTGKHLARLGTPRGGGGAGAMLTATPNSVLIDFQPKSAGLYTCKLLLRSHNTVCSSSDWRVYDLVAKVKEPNVKTLLEFVSPARHSIVQEIPLTNPSDAAWTLKALFGASAQASGFSGPTSVNVPPKKTINYPLTFAPKWISQEKTTLTLVNPSTQQQFEFELSGFGEEPLAQDHVVLKCQARTSIVHEFAVVSSKSDPPGMQTFKIESDLRDVVGAPSVTVPKAGETAKYSLTFSPIVSGTYFGSITFTNVKTNEYTWYTIEATVAPPAPEATLDMKTTVRGAMGVEISLENPLDHAVVFAIELQGNGLMGPSTFELDAKQSGVYELVYSPLYLTHGPEGAEDGAVLFSNDEIGQFWYALKLIAEPAQPTPIDDMSCAVGDVCTQPILLQNPSDMELWLQYRVTNTRNFSIKGGGNESGSPSSKSSSKSSTASSQSVVKLPPFGQASVVVEYTPSSLSEYEASSVIFFMPDVVSDWEFQVRGKGKAPSVMKPIRIQSKVMEAASSLFTFKNPFVDALRVDVRLLIDDVDVKVIKSTSSAMPPVFDILLKKSRVTLDGFGHLQVPISFLPQFVSEAHAEIVIQGQEEYGELEWRYPIHGVAEAPLHPKSFVLACQAREPLEKVVHCELLAAPPDFVLDEETITVEWEVDSARFGTLASADAIRRCLTATPLKPDDETPLSLPYLIQFEPLRPYRGSVHLLLHKKSGGKWRFDVVLDVGDPPVDDVVTIESTLNQTSSIAFQLRNQFRTAAPFHAEFSAGSSSAFTVYPPEGVLPPFGSEQGINFVVSFTPTGYGKMQSGQLLILTEEMQWTFNVKGTYPDMSSSLGSKSLSSSASRSRLGIDSVGTASPGVSTGSSGRTAKPGRSSGGSKR